MWSRCFSLDITCNNSKFQAIFVINYLAGKDEANKIINAGEIRKHGESPWRVSKYKWESKYALLQNILNFCIFLPKLVFLSLPLFNAFLPFLWKIVHMLLLSRICPNSHGEIGKKMWYQFYIDSFLCKDQDPMVLQWNQWCNNANISLVMFSEHNLENWRRLKYWPQRAPKISSPPTQYLFKRFP